MESIESYLERLASDSPTPGGGSAAMVVAASGAALVAMVARICLQSKKYLEQHSLARELIQQADRLRAGCLQARAHDEEAFAHVVATQSLPRGETRTQTLEAALYAAAQAPLHGASIALEVERLSGRLLEIPNRNLVSDVGCAAEFSAAAVRACAYNVRINHRFMKDVTAIAVQAERISRYEREAEALLHGIRAAL